MTNHRLPLDAFNDAFLVTAAGSAPLTHKQTRGPAYVAPSRGARYRADTDDEELALITATVLATGNGATPTDLSAAALWGLPLPPWIGLADIREKRLSIACPPGGSHRARRNVRGRRLELPDDHLTSLRGVRCTTVARTWVDCGAEIALPHLVAMGDFALRHRLTDHQELEDMVRWARGRRGVVSARTALPILDPRSESPAESVVRAHLVMDGVPRPECNVDIHGENGWIARVDLCWRRQRVIVEYDGAVHLDDSQRRRDAVRRNELQQAGWLVITLTADDLREPRRMVARVRRLLTDRTPALPSGEV